MEWNIVVYTGGMEWSVTGGKVQKVSGVDSMEYRQMG